MQNGDQSLPSIVLADWRLLVKCAYLLNPKIHFDKNLRTYTIHFNIVETLVCKMVTRLCRELDSPVVVNK